VTPEEIAQTKQKEQAHQDLADIVALRDLPAFNRYFIRRLQMKREAVRVAFENDPPEKCSHEEREIRRRILKTYDELLVMMQQDQRAAMSIVGDG